MRPTTRVVLILLMALAALVTGRSARAAIVINEIMYNSTEANDVEYVELINTGPSAQDLTGWYLLDDDDLHDRCMLSGTLGPGQLWVVAGSMSLFTAKYPGVTNLNPTGFTGAQPEDGFGLGNTSDDVRVFNAQDALVDRVPYGDVSPWPTQADGQGPSLELRHPSLDNTVASSWGASINAPPPGTPGGQNSIFVFDPAPVIGQVARDVPLPRAADTVTVTARVTDDQPSLVVDLFVDTGAGFSARPMLDDGLSGDGLAGDSTFGAAIEPLPTATVARYYVVATDTLPQTTTAPAAAPFEYFAYTVDHVPPSLAITEILASNQTGISDEFGQREDWLEIANRGTVSAALGGLFLSRDRSNTRMWPLPALPLAPGQRLRIWCDTDVQQGSLHASFTLPKEGGEVGLFDTVEHGNVEIHGYTFGPQNSDVSFGFLPEDSDAPEYLTPPTPGAANAAFVFSPICINEFLAASGVGVDDWIELYNRGTATVDVSGWHLSDDAQVTGKYTFPPGSLLPAGAFLVLDASELGFSLQADGDEVIVLTGPDGLLGEDYFDYSLQFPDVSQGRFADGTANWHLFSSSSRGLPNDCDQGVPPLPPVAGLHFDSPVALSWEPLAGAGSYDVVEGDLGLLLATGGDFAASLLGCVENDGADAATWVPAAPGGGGRFYLVRAVTPACGYGTYDSGAPSQIGSRDAGSGVADCP